MEEMRDSSGGEFRQRNRRALVHGLAALAVVVLVILAIEYLPRLTENRWRQGALDVPATQADRRGNVAVVWDGRNSVAIVATRYAGWGYEVAWDGDTAVVTVGDPNTPVRVPMSRSELSIVLPDGKRGRFPLARGFAQSYRKDMYRGTGSPLQGVVAAIDDLTLRAEVSRFLSGYNEPPGPAWVTSTSTPAEP